MKILPLALETAAAKTAAIALLESLAAETATSAMEHIPENISKDIIHITVLTTLKMELLITAIAAETALETALETAKAAASTAVSAACCAFFKGCKTILVIQLSLLLITENIIGFCDFLKLLLRLLIPRIRIRMIFLRQFSICTLNRLVVCFFIYTKNFIIISLSHHCPPPSL